MQIPSGTQRNPADIRGASLWKSMGERDIGSITNRSVVIVVVVAAAAAAAGLGCNFLYCTPNEVHPTHCVEVYLQCGLEEIRANMLLELSTQMLKEPCFNVLRTQEQLGYIVFSGVRRAHGVQGMRFIVQSEKPPAYVDARIEAFLHSMEVVSIRLLSHCYLTVSNRISLSLFSALPLFRSSALPLFRLFLLAIQTGIETTGSADAPPIAFRGPTG